MGIETLKQMQKQLRILICKIADKLCDYEIFMAEKTLLGR